MEHDWALLGRNYIVAYERNKSKYDLFSSDLIEHGIYLCFEIVIFHSSWGIKWYNWVVRNTGSFKGNSSFHKKGKNMTDPGPYQRQVA